MEKHGQPGLETDCANAGVWRLVTTGVAHATAEATPIRLIIERRDRPSSGTRSLRSLPSLGSSGMRPPLVGAVLHASVARAPIPETNACSRSTQMLAVVPLGIESNSDAGSVKAPSSSSRQSIQYDSLHAAYISPG